MAAPYVPASTQTALHGQLAAMQQQLRTALYNLKTVNDLMAQMISGNDYTVLESQFGYTAGQGTFVFAQVNGTYLALTTDSQQTNVSSKINQLLDQIG